MKLNPKQDLKQYLLLTRAAPPVLARSALIIFLVLTVLMFLQALQLPAVQALQVSPAAKHLNLDPTDISSQLPAYTLTIRNDEAHPRNILIQAPPNITVDPAAFTLPPKGKQAVTVRFTGDAARLPPGDTTFPLRVTLTTAAGKTQFTAGISLVHQLILTRPYNGSFLTGELHFPPGAPRLVLVLTNKGRRATIAHGTLQLGPTSMDVALSVPGRGSARTTQPIELPPGAYDAHAQLQYADGVESRTLTLNGHFAIGQPKLALGQPRAQLTEQETGVLTAPVTLEWNQPLTLTIQAELYREGTLATQEQRRVELAPGTGEVTAYLTPPAPGEYEVVLALADHGTPLAETRANLTVQPRPEPPSSPDQAGGRAANLVVALVLSLLALLLVLARRRATTRK